MGRRKTRTKSWNLGSPYPSSTPTKAGVRCDVILDTGFTGWLTLPEPIIRELGLVKIGSRPATLASGEVEEFDYYETRIVWHDQLRWVLVLRSIDQPLLGMELLRDNWITMGAWDGGDVLIDETRP